MLNHLLHVAVLCSKRAPGLPELLHHPSHGVLFEIDAVLTTELSLPECGVPVITHPIRSFYDDFDKPITDRAVRRHYDAVTAHALQQLGIDVVVLLGYLYVITEPMLARYPDRIFNVHDSDLSLRRSDGRTRYPGLHATRDAIRAGEKQTRSSIHIVTSDLDAGPMIGRSEAFPVASFATEAAAVGADDIVRAYAYAQREWMMRSAWGNLVAAALEQMSVLDEVAL